MAKQKNATRVDPVPKVPARHVIEAQADKLHKNLRHQRFTDKVDGGESEITLRVLRDARDRTSAIWYLREKEQDARQRARDAYVKKYRPIQTLDGLDPHWSRNGLTGYAAALKALMRAGWVHHG